jgi:hypothetical protein
LCKKVIVANYFFKHVPSKTITRSNQNTFHRKFTCSSLDNTTRQQSRYHFQILLIRNNSYYYYYYY